MDAKRTLKQQLAARGLVALDRAISIAGTQEQLAMLIGVTPGAISHWRRKGMPIPLEHVPRIVALAQDVRVSPYTLRPDYAEGWALLARQLAACHVGVMHSVWTDDEPEAEAVTA
jgi:DNA-binding transcriptional regulator YdaS (Cro superfamily)